VALGVTLLRQYEHNKFVDICRCHRRRRMVVVVKVARGGGMLGGKRQMIGKNKNIILYVVQHSGQLNTAERLQLRDSAE